MVSLIRRIRYEMGLTQLEFANKLGTTQANVSIWENGGCNPCLLHAKKIVTFAKSVGIKTSIDKIRKTKLV